MLLDVIGAWVNIVESDVAATRMADIKEKTGDTYFAWSGPTAKGRAAYFRVQGPTVCDRICAAGWDRSHPHGGAQSERRLRRRVFEKVSVNEQNDSEERR